MKYFTVQKTVFYNTMLEWIKTGFTVFKLDTAQLTSNDVLGLTQCVGFATR